MAKIENRKSKIENEIGHPFLEWKRKHLLGLRELSAEEITFILDTAAGFEQLSARAVKKAPTLRSICPRAACG